MNRLEETRKIVKFKKTLFGLKDNVFTFAIGTPENPMAQKKTDEENEELRKKFEYELRSHKLSFYKVLGKYEDFENSYLIPNIPLKLCKHLFGKEKYNQESFIYGEVHDNQKIHYYYFEQNNNGEFIQRDDYDESKMSKNAEEDFYSTLRKDDAEEFYTKYIDYKFSIPFSIFESYLRDYSERLDERVKWNPNYRKELKELLFDENKTLGSFWRNINQLLLSKEQEKERRERVKIGEREMEKFEETRKSVKFKKTLFGVKDNVFTFAIGTPENPMAQKKTDRENAEARKEFEDWLTAHKLSYYKATGKYGNEEISYLVPNINLEQCKYIFGKEKFNQESFIFGKIDDDKKIHYFYYEQSGNGIFNLVDEYDEANATERGKGNVYHSLNQNDAEDFYTKYIDYKFSIPFSIFEKHLRDYSEYLDERLHYNPNYKKELKRLVLAENKTLSSLWRNMNTLLLSEKQEKARKERISKYL